MTPPTIYLQSEYFLPDGRQSLVFGLCLQPVIDNLNHGEGITLTAEVSGVEPLGLHDLDNKMTNVFHLVKCVAQSLKVQYNALIEIEILKKYPHYIFLPNFKLQSRI